MKEGGGATHLEYDSPISMDVALVAKDHAESHGVIGTLWNVLHQLKSLLQSTSLHGCLLSRLLQVTQQQLILSDPLNWFDEV